MRVSAAGRKQRLRTLLRTGTLLTASGRAVADTLIAALEGTQLHLPPARIQGQWCVLYSTDATLMLPRAVGDMPPPLVAFDLPHALEVLQVAVP
jgi:hypothetical protein